MKNIYVIVSQNDNELLMATRELLESIFGSSISFCNENIFSGSFQKELDEKQVKENWETIQNSDLALVLDSLSFRKNGWNIVEASIANAYGIPIYSIEFDVEDPIVLYRNYKKFSGLKFSELDTFINKFSDIKIPPRQRKYYIKEYLLKLKKIYPNNIELNRKDFSIMFSGFLGFIVYRTISIIKKRFKRE